MSYIFYDKQKKKSATPIIVFLCILFLLLGIGALLIAFSKAAEDVDNNISQETENIMANTSGDLQTNNSESSENSEPDEQVIGQTDENVSSISKYDYSAEVPMSSSKPIEYLNDAAFLGDSITEGMKLHNSSDAFIASAVSMSTIGCMENPQATYNEKTLLQALNEVKAKKIYVMLGSNEIGGYKIDVYLSRYGALIDSIKESNPDAIIYLQSVTPVTKAYEDSGQIPNNTQIKDANAQLKLLAFEKKIFFIDVNSALLGEDGCLPDDASPKDGVHFGTTYFNKWIDYLLTHTVDPDEYTSQKDTYYAP